MDLEDNKKPISDREKWDLLTRQERLGEILLKRNKITLQQLEELMNEQNKTKKPLGELILEKRWMSQGEILEALDWQHQTDQVIIESLKELKLKPEDPC